MPPEFENAYDLYYSHSNSKHSYSFTTETNIEYAVIINEFYPLLFDFEDYIDSNLYSMTLLVVNGDYSGGIHARIGLTVSKIIYHFLETTGYSLAYICDSSDSRQHRRYLRFYRWINTYNSSNINFIINQYSITDGSIDDSYFGLIRLHDDGQLDNYIDCIKQYLYQNI